MLNHRDLYSWTAGQVAGGVSFPYPALTALLFVPFAPFASGQGVIVYALICMASLFGALRVLDVRDWRVYGIAMLFSPVVAAWGIGNLTLPLAFGIALIWRFRERALLAGLFTALVISVKLFVWPIGLWLLATRRYRAALAALLFGAVFNLVAWATVGFDEVSAFLRLTNLVTKTLYQAGYGVIAETSQMGMSYRAGEMTVVVLSTGLAVAVVFIARRYGDLPGLASCIALMLVASPLVWSHYFALLIVPLAIAYPTMNRAWVLPLLFWAGPVGGVVGKTLSQPELAIVWLVAVAVLIVTSMQTPTICPKLLLASSAAWRSLAVRFSTQHDAQTLSGSTVAVESIAASRLRIAAQNNGPEPTAAPRVQLNRSRSPSPSNSRFSSDIWIVRQRWFSIHPAVVPSTAFRRSPTLLPRWSSGFKSEKRTSKASTTRSPSSASLTSNSLSGSGSRSPGTADTARDLRPSRLSSCARVLSSSCNTSMATPSPAFGCFAEWTPTQTNSEPNSPTASDSTPATTAGPNAVTAGSTLAPASQPDPLDGMLWAATSEPPLSVFDQSTSLKRHCARQGR